MSYIQLQKIFCVVFLALVGRVQSYDLVALDDVKLNRIGGKLSSDDLSSFPNALEGFTWNDGDGSTQSWRPQGITGITSPASEYIAVSWYGRDQASYANRGVRISFADISDMDAISYRHILLVDEEFNTFEGMHGGGLAYSAECECIHVPDSRSGTKQVYTFSINNILYIPESDRGSFYDYTYVLPRQSSYDVPITPSFMSFDHDRNQIVLGTFYQCSSYHIDSEECLSMTNNQLTWYSIGDVDGETAACAPLFSEMQGAASGASFDNTTHTQILWTSSSYGSGHDSHLHISSVDVDQCLAGTPYNSTVRTVIYPPGLEDMFLTQSTVATTPTYLWMLTEFGTKDGSGNFRAVFSTDVTNILP